MARWNCSVARNTIRIEGQKLNIDTERGCEITALARAYAVKIEFVCSERSQ